MYHNILYQKQYNLKQADNKYHKLAYTIAYPGTAVFA